VTDSGRLLRRLTSGSVVLVAHVLLALFISSSLIQPRTARSPTEENVLVTIAVPEVHLRSAIPRTRREHASEYAALTAIQSAPPPTIPSVNTPAAPVVDAGPPIDWAEASHRAAIAAAQTSPRLTPDCDPWKSPEREKRPCKKPRSFDWRPNPRPVEFAGFLPYVHVGDNCVVGLGFFGCGVGPAAKSNGHLFDGIKDADRPQSSVP